MENIVLSICIPTYNGGERLEKLIKLILKSSRQDIEIAVTDNCSSDNTIELLRKIGDKRLQIYQNKSNLGAFANGVRSLANGKGKYVMLLLDRDVIQIKCLDVYLEFLKCHDYGVIINLCKHYGEIESKIIEREELYYFLTKVPHPSFYTFRRDCLEHIDMTRSIRENGYYNAMIGLAIAQIAEVYMNTSIPVVLEAEVQYVLMHNSRSWNVIPDEIKEKCLSYDPRSQKIRLKQYYDFVLTISNEYELTYAQRGIYLALLENAMDYIHEIESARGRHRYPLDDLGYALFDYVKVADDFYKFYLSCVNDVDEKKNRECINTFTELVRLQFINDTFPQLQSSYNANCERIYNLHNKLCQMGISYQVNLYKDVIYREGAGVGKNAE